MLSIKKTKDNLTRRFTPFLFKEFLRILNIYTKVTVRGLDNNHIDAFKYLSKYVIEHHFHAYKYGSVWTTLFVPSEILFAMQLPTFSLEIAAALFARYGRSTQGFAEADLFAIPTDVCSFHRAAIGHAFTGLYPPPKFLVGTTTICDSNLKTIKICESQSGKESLIIDVPYEMTDSSVKYLSDQLRNLTKCLEKASGKTMDEDSLRKAIDLSNQAREKMIEINRVREDPLSPLMGQDSLGFMLPSHLLIGSQYAVDFYSKLLEELKKKIASKKREGIKEEEKIKILWLELKPYFRSDIFDKIESAQNVKIVFEEINHVYWEKLDPDKPYESIARKLISNHNNGPLERRLDVIKMLSKKYHANGIIAFSTWGCRRNNAAIPTIKKEMNREGYPLLNLDGDCVDDSSYMSGQITTRIEGFLEMLGARK
ncbi:MAG: 2-hydroxyacyl-CoA dehydratase [Candidatus Scalindua sp. AMX11]|nr:MAG: 2-hydroxyacyl-CoA dehydratase [Candidatus Scalindua sp.]NOG85618.1 2-hydroxyacyl-CoA dehydratase [Planctomycetota bacterium]RZV82483.1 MAG: 2-hydroxyacyl-CoA dehydratase [Candidatus Scalindua sp. SCAELEC01]TDE65591.1 MAG: 2-hydroxyacyl-CoA dehydratase [Candidatus Scalindua sp. AMX11]GJQ59215.1 MAG: 2-hydroxyglutaryl-CoA dehydratase [Candidatus Scalindua sp.]